MLKINFPPSLKVGDVIGVTSPSSGVAPELEKRLSCCIEEVAASGFEVELGDCLVSSAIVSADRQSRAQELIGMLADDRIKALVPPWGGELLINLLPLLDFSALGQLQPKWIVGYSDISTFLMPYTMLTGIATLHGSNFMEAAYRSPDTHTHWLDAIRLTAGDSFVQKSATRYQTKFTDYKGDPAVSKWGEDVPICWKLLGHEDDKEVAATVSGRLIGGCLETISMLPGTKFGDVAKFAREYAPEGLLIYLEVCEEPAPTACRMFHHLKLAGWFDVAKGILIGRTQAKDTHNLTQRDALNDVFADLSVPVIYDMDIGHVPPQMLLVNGALATVTLESQGGTIKQVLE